MRLQQLPGSFSCCCIREEPLQHIFSCAPSLLLLLLLLQLLQLRVCAE